MYYFEINYTLIKMQTNIFVLVSLPHTRTTLQQ